MTADVHARGDALREHCVVTRVIDAPRPLLHTALTRREALAHFWGAHGWSLPGCAVDPRPGGGFRFGLCGADGEDRAWHGVYEDVADDRIVLVSGDEAAPAGAARVQIDLEPTEDGTRVTVSQWRPRGSDSPPLDERGWAECLERLDAHVHVAWDFLQPRIRRAGGRREHADPRTDFGLLVLRAVAAVPLLADAVYALIVAQPEPGNLPRDSAGLRVISALRIVASAALLLGLRTREAAGLSLATLAVAGASGQVPGLDGPPGRIRIDSGVQGTLVLAGVLVAVCLMGPGRFSVDHVLRRARLRDEG